MYKRKRVYGPPSGSLIDAYIADRNDVIPEIPVPIHPANESTVLIETGGEALDSVIDYVGQDRSVPITASMRGAAALQYNDFFWDNSMYTFTQNNCMIGLVFVCWNRLTGRKKQIIYPIVIPPMRKMTFASRSSPSFDKTHIHVLRQQLAYALNLSFAAIFSSFYKGWTISPKRWDKMEEFDPECPLFPPAPTLGPVMWVVTDEGHLALVNRSKTAGGFVNQRFAFNLVTMQKEWFTSTNYYNMTPGKYKFYNDIPPQMNFTTMFGEENGWIGGGANVFGFGQPNPQQASSFSSSSAAYVDDYTAAGVGYSSLFANTDWAQENPANLTILPTDADFDAYIAENMLYEHVLYAPRPALMAPSRFYVLASEQLSKTQRRPVSSNLAVLSSANILAVVFPNYLADFANGSGGVVSHTSQLTHPNINISTQNSGLQNIDILMYDEYDQLVSNCLLGARDDPYPLPFTYHPPASAPVPMPFDSVADIYWYENLHGDPPNSQLPPGPFIAAFNPNPLENPNGDYLLGPFHGQNQKPMWGVSTGSKAVNLVSAATTRSTMGKMPPSSYFIHFLRLISSG